MKSDQKVRTVRKSYREREKERAPWHETMEARVELAVEAIKGKGENFP